MKHVVWNEKSSGPGVADGVNAVRAFLCTYYAPLFDPELLAMKARKGETEPALPARGPFDGDLRYWVKLFQDSFNRSKSPAVTRVKAKLPNKKLVETGDIDWGTRIVMGIDEALARDDAILLPVGVGAKVASLTATELKAAHRDERFVGNAYRVEGLDGLLTKLGLRDVPEEAASRMRIAPLDEGNFVVPEGHVLYNTAADKSECAALVQTLGVPNTNQWRRGPRVQDIEFLPRGTVIATLGTGVYLSDYSGKSHVGIFLSKDDHGLWMLDQYRGGEGKVGIRFKKFGAPHSRTRVKASRYLVDDYSYRMEVVDESGHKTYARDFSLETIRYRTNLTGDGSEYYVLLDDGKVARRDSRAHRLRTPEENREGINELVTEMFGMSSAQLAEKWRRETEESMKAVREAANAVKRAP
jgi:hypothetical protein